MKKTRGTVHFGRFAVDSKRRIILKTAEEIYRASRLKLIEELISAFEGKAAAALVLRHQWKVEHSLLIELLRRPGSEIDRWKQVSVATVRDKNGDLVIEIEGEMAPSVSKWEPFLLADAAPGALPMYQENFAWEIAGDGDDHALTMQAVADPLARLVMNLLRWINGIVAELYRIELSGNGNESGLWGQLVANAIAIGELGKSSGDVQVSENAILKLFGPSEAGERQKMIALVGNPATAGLIAQAMLVDTINQAVAWATEQERLPRRRLMAVRQVLVTTAENLEQNLRHLAQLIDQGADKRARLPVSWREM